MLICLKLTSAMSKYRGLSKRNQKIIFITVISYFPKLIHATHMNIHSCVVVLMRKILQKCEPFMMQNMDL